MMSSRIDKLKLLNALKAQRSMPFKKRKKYLSQQGLSLIELMIVILLASFLILGITKIFSGNAISSKVAKDLGYATEGGGYGSLLLIKYLRLTGYTNYFQLNDDRSVVNKVIFGGAGASVDNGEFDEVVIEYEAPVRSHIDPNQRYITCGGIDVDGGTRVKETFRVRDSRLECVSSAGGVSGASILVAGVDGFQVQYGLSANASKASVNRYVNATTATALLQGPANQLVRSIRFAMLVRSDEKKSGANTTDSFQLLDTQVSSKQASIVNSSYRVYETTVAIFNAEKGRLP